MASSILSSLVRMTDKLSAPIRRSFGLSSSSDPRAVEEDLGKLRRTAETINAVLYDAEKREIREESVRLWLQELRGVAYDAEDVLDEFEYELLRSKLEAEATAKPTRKRKHDEVRQLVASPLNEASLRDSLARRVKEIRERFDEIAKDRLALRLREGDGPRREANHMHPPPTSPQAPVEVFGREKDTMKVIELLLSEKDYKGTSVHVIPIVGMAGVGKTTLIQLIYNDSRVCQHFEARGWVGVFKNFDTARLLREIIESVTKSPCNLTELGALQESVMDELQGKRFLLVLDDVWNEDQMLWERLRFSWTSDVEGSRIIVTTRNEQAARIMQTMPLYQLNCLSDDDCWLLFQRRAFDGRDPDKHPDLVATGRMIANKCRGLPLAAKALGGLLRYETDEERWTDLLQSDMWDLEDNENEILPALKLSYQHLPVELKRCFAYCSVFPKGYVFKKDQLTRLWMVHGFIQAVDGKEPEDIGGEYFDDLLWRSFFQQSLLDIGEEEKFVMHDLLHDLARYISGEECSVTADSDLGNVSTDARHLSLMAYSSKTTLQFKAADRPRPLRSLLLIYKMINLWGGIVLWEGNLVRAEIPNDVFLNLGCLRTLDLCYTDIEELPSSIGNLKHLRYLSLRNTKIHKLPESIGKLFYLQTLELKYCGNLHELPIGIGNLVNLRHLELPTMEDSHVCMPSGIGRLTGLQELSAFNVQGDSWHCGIGELKDMVNLRGSLHISGLRNVARGWDAAEACLKNKKNLQRLTIDWYVHQSDYKCSHLKLNSSDDLITAKHGNMDVVTMPWEQFEEEGVVLENLQPHANLGELHIRNYNGARFPKWIGDSSFANLMSVRFYLCENCEALPSLGELPSLKNLYIAGMGSVRFIAREFCGTKKFPALERLKFEWMPELEEWNGAEGGAFPCLAELTISNCPKLRSVPERLAPTLKKLDIGDCKRLTVLPVAPTLTSLCLGGVSQEIWSYLEDLYVLEELEVNYCEGLTILPLYNMVALRRMEIVGCSQLATIACRGDPSSANAAASSSSMSLQGGLHTLVALEQLKIEDCPMLHFSMDERLPSALKDVEISCCPMLMKWCSGPEVSSQLAQMPNVTVMDYDQDQFQEWVMDMANEESVEDMEEDEED